ncbi:putative phage abortive infection protein [Segatella oris]|jgi:hypothetical protein|nr:putative phage abortive infection protein [Segatella oris]OFP33303.1 hypothetical protein HMPREF2992_10730 [Prevotella sp. HMSC069G02]
MKKNLMFWMAIIFLVAGILLCVYFLYMGISQKVFSNSYVVEQLKNNLGSFISGTIGILFTITATIFLFITFREQRKQFELSKQSQEQSRFETTYFNLLLMLDDVRDNVNKNIAQHFNTPDITTIWDYYGLMKEYYTIYPKEENKDNFETIMDRLSSNSLNTEKDMAQGCILDFFDSFVGKHNFSIGYFFRYIYNTINFVVTERNAVQDKTENTDIQRYLNILQAQLSDEELALIFYDALSSFGKNKHGYKQFHTLLNTYQFLENINEHFLLHRNHHVFYQKTFFKFLNRDERRLKKKCL